MSKQLISKKGLKKAEIITVSGGKGGVGKTFFSVNFAVELSNRGYKVLLFDGDLNLSNVNILLHIYDSSNFSKFLNGQCTIDEVILKGIGGVDVIYAGEDIDTLLNMDESTINRISESIALIESKYDFIIVDTQAGVNDFNINLVTGSDRVIMITNQEITSLVDLYKVIKVISGKKSGMRYEIVVNRVIRPETAAFVFKKISDTVQNFKIRSTLDLLGYILDDTKRVLESIQKQIPFVILHENSPISECFRIIVNNFLRNKKQKKNISFLNLLLGRE